MAWFEWLSYYFLLTVICLMCLEGFGSCTFVQSFPSINPSYSFIRPFVGVITPLITPKNWPKRPKRKPDCLPTIDFQGFLPGGVRFREANRVASTICLSKGCDTGGAKELGVIWPSDFAFSQVGGET